MVHNTYVNVMFVWLNVHHTQLAYFTINLLLSLCEELQFVLIFVQAMCILCMYLG